MKFGEMFPSKYLKESDLEGQSKVFTIKNVVQEEVGQEKKPCPVMYFLEVSKGVIVNATKKAVIEGKYGNADDLDVSLLIGEKIQLSPGKAFYSGKMVAAIDFTIPKETNPPVSGTADTSTAVSGATIDDEPLF